MKKMSSRERTIFLLMMIIMGGYGLWVGVGEPLYNKQKNADHEIESKILFINRYHSILNQKEYYTKKENLNQALEEELKRRFLNETKPALAAAGLQNILKEHAGKNSVHIVQESIEKPTYTVGLLTVPVRLTVRSSLRNLTGFIQSLENHSKFLVVEEMQSRRINRNEPEYLETRMIISGFIQQKEPETQKRT